MRDPIDYTPLTSTPTQVQSEQVREEAARGDLGASTAKGTAASRSRARTIGGGIGGLLVLIGVLTLVVNSVKTGAGDDTGVGVGFVVLGAVLGTLVWWLVRAADRRAWARTTRLVLFAQANRLEVEPFGDVQKVPGVVGREGRYAWTRGLVRWNVRGRPAHLATYHWGYSSGGVDCRYLAIDLGLDLPSMGFVSGHVAVWRPEPRFGPAVFDGTSYSLKMGGLELDVRARALFCDELVRLLTDPAHPTNAEVVDGWFIGYVRRTPGVAVDEWQHVFAVADLVTRQVDLLRP